MDAIVSGHAGVALLVDGEDLRSLHYDRPGEIFPRRASDANLLLGGAKDLCLLRDVDIDEVVTRLEQDALRIDALHLALILLDSELSLKTRKAAAFELQDIIASNGLRHSLERILFSQALPAEADLLGALEYCPSLCLEVASLLHILACVQPMAIRVRRAWEAIPSRAFAGYESRAVAQAIAVREGLFWHFVMQEACGVPADTERLEYFASLMPTQPEDSQAIVHYWASIIREKTHEHAAKAPGEVTPEHSVASLIATIWSDVLGVDSLDTSANFFELGGHSLLATQVVSRLRRQFDAELPLKAIFESPTIAGLASRVEAATKLAASENPELRRLPLAAREAGLPLSFAQQRLWFLDCLQPGFAGYNFPVSVRIDGALQTSVLQTALSEIVRRHEVLRTTFSHSGGRPLQIVGPAMAVPLPQVDLSSLPEALRWTAASGLAREVAHIPFDLSQGPLLRAYLLGLSSETHLLVVLMHHIVFDAWSAGIFIRELFELVGASSILPEPPIQYCDFAVWQRRWLSGGILGRQLDYWLTRLQGDQPVLELPTDHPRPPIQSSQGAERAFRLRPEQWTMVNKIARSEGATSFMVFLAVFYTFLFRMTGQSDISIGSPIAGRNRIELESIIGFFVNTLVLRAGVTGDVSLTHLIQMVRTISLEAYANSDVPFEKLIEELNPERSLSHSPLFQVLFSLTHQAQTDKTLLAPGLLLRPFNLNFALAKFDLSLFISEGESSVGIFEYNAKLFEEVTISRFAAYFDTLLSGAISCPQRGLSSLPLLTDYEIHQVAREWNDCASYLQLWPVHERVELQAASLPHHQAIVWDGGAWDYSDLNRRANQLACELIHLGIGPELCVGVYAERGPELAVALLGILKAGGAYVPLDVMYPKERIRFLALDAKMRALVVQDGLDCPLPSYNIPILNIKKEQEFVGNDRNPRCAIGPDNMAYVVYTSGSTGTPKGIGLSHLALANLIAWQIAQLPEKGCRILQFAPSGFDVSIQEMLTSLCSGGTLFFASEETRRDPKDLLQYLAVNQVDHLFMPYVALQQMAEESARLEAGTNEGESAEAWSNLSLRRIIASGERLQITPQIVAFCERIPGFEVQGRICNQYGPSETHVATEFVLEPGAWPALPPIGRPISGVSVYILDNNNRPVPIGVAGQLVIGGVCLARGYLDRPDWTAERFVPDDLGGGAGDRLYRTGDLARFRSTGDIEFLGRLDQQLKIRGFRVEPEEIEVTLASHPKVREAAVCVWGNASSADTFLTAYIVPERGEEIEASQVREFVRERLPTYMVPVSFVNVSSLPLTPTGKLNRGALPVPARSRDLASEYIEPRNELEHAVASTVTQVLRINRTGVEDSFFDLGAHSLLVIQLAHALTKDLGWRVQVSEVFQYPTVASLAQHLAREQGLLPQNDVTDGLVTKMKLYSRLSAVATLYREKRGG